MAEKSEARQSEQPKAADPAVGEGKPGAQQSPEQRQEAIAAGDDFQRRLQEADPKNEDREISAAQSVPFAGVPHGGGQSVGASGHPEVHFWLAEAETARLNGNAERRQVIVDELRKHGYEVG